MQDNIWRKFKEKIYLDEIRYSFVWGLFSLIILNTFLKINELCIQNNIILFYLNSKILEEIINKFSTVSFSILTILIPLILIPIERSRSKNEIVNILIKDEFFSFLILNFLLFYQNIFIRFFLVYKKRYSLPVINFTLKNNISLIIQSFLSIIFLVIIFLIIFKDYLSKGLNIFEGHKFTKSLIFVYIFFLSHIISLVKNTNNIDFYYVIAIILSTIFLSLRFYQMIYFIMNIENDDYIIDKIKKYIYKYNNHENNKMDAIFIFLYIKKKEF